jgi:RNA-directed DNA polymerase
MQEKTKIDKTQSGTKPFPVTEQMVWDAYQKVKTKGKAYGVDEMSMKDFEVKLSGNLYKIWNRLSSGTYMPPAVREVEIPKKDGKLRKLGIPTVGDRIAQTVVKDYMETSIDKLFHESFYGYRPLKGAHQALEKARIKVKNYDWVIDMDIKGFFDNISHALILKALDKVVAEKWVKMYCKRWLEMRVQKKPMGQ